VVEGSLLLHQRSYLRMLIKVLLISMTLKADGFDKIMVISLKINTV